MNRINSPLFIALFILLGLNVSFGQNGTRFGLTTRPYQVQTKIEPLASISLPNQFLQIQNIYGNSHGIDILHGFGENFSVSTGVNMSKNIMHVTVLDEASTMVTPIRFTTYEVPITINIRKQLFPCSTMYLKTQIGTTLDFIHESGISSNTATYIPSNAGTNSSFPEYTAKVSPIKPPVPNIVVGLALEIDMGAGWGFFDAGVRYKNYVNGISNLSLVYTDDAHANEKFNIGKSGFIQFELRYYLPDFKHFTTY